MKRRFSVAEMEGVRVQEEYEAPLGAESSPGRHGKKIGTSVLQLQGAEFCQQQNEFGKGPYPPYENAAS